MQTARVQMMVVRCWHPVGILAILLLCVNIWVLQPLFPGWWSGKLGDFAWLILAPMLLAVASTALLGRQLGERMIAGLAIMLSGGVFVLLKLSPAANAAVASGYERITGLPAKLAHDPSDLLMLPGLLLAWWLLTRPIVLHQQWRKRQLVVLGAAALALVADSPAPQDFGVVCIAGQGSDLVAVTKFQQHSYFQSRTDYDLYRSSDQGVSWQADAKAVQQPPCDIDSPPEIIMFYDRQQAGVEYMLRSGNGIYRSGDGGITFTRELELKTSLLSYFVVPSDHRILVAAGKAGIALRTPDGVWQVIPVQQTATL